MSTFEAIYREAWAAQLEGRDREADACFDVAKKAAGDAVRQGATGEQLAQVMRRSCAALEEQLGVPVPTAFL